MRRLALLFSLALTGLAGLPHTALAADPADSSTSDFARSFNKLRAHDDYVQQIAWHLRTGNAAFCASAGADIGLMLQDAAAYPDIPAVRKFNGIGGDFFVHSVVEGSPAQLAGLEPGMEVLDISGTALTGFAFDPKAKWRRLSAINEHLRKVTAESGSASFTLAGSPEPITISGVAACPGRFELLTGYDIASANRERVAIGAEFVGLTYPEEEFAAVMAHELAHILLKHPDWLDANGRGRRNIRSTEREADQLMPWLLANAGYDPAAALRFMKRWGPKHSGGLFRKRTHDGWDERVEFIEQQLPLVREASGDQGQADWSTRFPARIISD